MGIQIKKFRAPTLQEAIELVRNELGDDAIILQTENVKENRGVLSRSVVEVTAAMDRKDPIRFHATVDEGAHERSAVAKDESKKHWWNVLLPKKAEPPQANVKTNAPPQKTAPSAGVGAYQKNMASGASAAAASSPAKPEALNQMYAIKTFVEPLQKEIENLKQKVEEKPSTTSSVMNTPKKKKVFDPLEGELKQLRAELNTFILEKRYDHLHLNPYFKKLMHFWQSKGVPGKMILNFFKEMETHSEGFGSEVAAPDQVQQALNEAIHEANVFAPARKRIVVLVGPTGVGKTTTIAKMAAYEKIKLKRSVCLISLDDFKIGGSDQLHHYARILEVPFVRSRPDVSLEEIISVQDADTIFVDTFGISPKDEQRLESLQRILQFENQELVERIETHLVVPVGIAPKDTHQMIQAFNALKPQYLLFTKWDETENWGGMLSTILESRKPVSLICHGQSVPDDMEVFSKNQFLEAIRPEANEQSH